MFRSIYKSKEHYLNSFFPLMLKFNNGTCKTSSNSRKSNSIAQTNVLNIIDLLTLVKLICRFFIYPHLSCYFKILISLAQVILNFMLHKPSNAMYLQQTNCKLIDCEVLSSRYVPCKFYSQSISLFLTIKKCIEFAMELTIYWMGSSNSWLLP